MTESSMSNALNIKLKSHPRELDHTAQSTLELLLITAVCRNATATMERMVFSIPGTRQCHVTITTVN